MLPVVPDEAVDQLLGKSKANLNPEENDFKALASYAVGKGLIDAEDVRQALRDDNVEAPLYWLAGLSGKTFGENVSPRICAYWLQRDEDHWKKHPGTDYFDVSWTPYETSKPVRIEIKASSEAPGYRFQQIRDPRQTGAVGLDYDALLCAGVTASELEFWFIPGREVVRFIDSGVFANQHGGAKSVSNTFWFVADARTRTTLVEYRAEATELRELALSLTLE